MKARDIIHAAVERMREKGYEVITEMTTKDKTIHLEPKMVPNELRGNYTGRHFKAIITDRVTVPANAGLWEGGTRETWDVIDIRGRHRVSDGNTAFSSLQKEQTIVLTPGMLVRRHHQSHPISSLTFYIHAETAAKLLPPPTQPITIFEREVLRATRVYKSSYQGRDRYQMSQDETKFTRSHVPVMTRKQWEEAKASLIEKGLLNKAGAITVSGRNAISDVES